LTSQYDIVIIGGGAAGFSALVKISESQNGRKIAMVNSGPLGGTCVNVGCVPSKRLIEIAKKTYLFRKYNEIYWKGESILNISGVLSDIRTLRDKLRKLKYEDVIEYYDVELYRGRAFFRGDQTLEIVGEKRRIIKGDKFIIATGSRPYVPNIKGINEIPYVTSDTIWEIEDDFESILIVGGGAIGIEFAQSFNRLGIETYVVDILERIIPSTEPEISAKLAYTLRREGVKLFLGSSVIKFSKKGSEVEATIKLKNGNRRIVRSDVVLVATGRRPNTDNLNLDKVGVKINEVGYIVVDDFLRTTNPKVYAAGDVTNTWKPSNLETISAREGSIAALNILKTNKFKVRHDFVPVTIFTDPELSFVGKREEDVIKETGSCMCRLVDFKLLAKARLVDEEEGAAKIIIDPRNRRLVGVHIYAHNSSEYITQAAIMVEKGYTIEDIINSPSIFPSASEIIKLTAQAFIRNIGRMPCCVE